MKIRNGREIKPLDNQINSDQSLIPKLPFSMSVIGAKGASKTTTILNMLLSKDLLNQKFNEIFVISPTASLDSKWAVLKESKILAINKPLINAYKKHSNIKKILDSKTDNNEQQEYNQELDDSNYITIPSLEFLKDLIKQQKHVINEFGKEIANTILLIFDDCISNKKFFNSEIVRGCLFNSRHYKISLCLTSQSYFDIPKAIRLNSSLNLIYFTGNMNEMKAIYEENSSGMTFKDFYKIYLDTCNSKPFHFLTINYQNDIKHRLLSGFENFILDD